MKLLCFVLLSLASFSVNAGNIESISPPQDVLENGEVSYKQIRVSCVSSSEPRYIRKASGLKQWCVSHNISSCSTKKLTAAAKACKLKLNDAQAVNIAKVGDAATQKPIPKEAEAVVKTEAAPEVAAKVPAKNSKLALELRKLEIDQQKLDVRKQQLDLRKHERELQRMKKTSSVGGSE